MLNQASIHMLHSTLEVRLNNQLLLLEEENLGGGKGKKVQKWAVKMVASMADY